MNHCMRWLIYLEKLDNKAYRNMGVTGLESIRRSQYDLYISLAWINMPDKVVGFIGGNPSNQNLGKG
jgi:hypothetical protein